MKALTIALEEIFGLFVEDGSLAIGILVWIGIAAAIFSRLPVGTAWRAPILFVGLLLILTENVLRSARKHLRAQK